MADEIIAPESSSVIVRSRELSTKPQRKVGVPMATYRVVLRIDVDECNIVHSRGKALEELKAEGGDYLRAYVENEMGWLEKSFGHVEIESVTRVKKSKSKK